MHFSRILWDLANKKEALLLNAAKQTLVIIPSGKYAGVWRYHKSIKRTTWEPIWLEDLAPRQVINLNGKQINFPLPTVAYSLYGMKHPGRIHKENRKDLGYATSNWKHLRETKVDSLISSYTKIADQIGDDYRIKAGLSLACMFALPTMLDVMSKSKELAAQKAMLLYYSGQMISIMKPTQRQRFITRILERDFKTALSLSFKKASRDVIEECVQRLPGYFPDAGIKLRSDWGSVDLNVSSEIISLAQMFTPMKIKKVKTITWTEA